MATEGMIDLDEIEQQYGSDGRATIMYSEDVLDLVARLRAAEVELEMVRAGANDIVGVQESERVVAAESMASLFANWNAEKARADRLARALETYGEHLDGCGALTEWTEDGTVPPCACGLIAALAPDAAGDGG